MKELEAKSNRDKEGNSISLSSKPFKKSRFLQKGLFSESEEDEDEDKGRAERELALYKDEPWMKAEGNPFKWWRSRASSYPLLARCL